MLKLYLARHGVTQWNSEGRLQGQTDTPLAPEGRDQARCLAHRLASEPVEAVYTSDLSRARETAEIIAEPHRLSVVVTPVLREAGFGLWEGLTETEIIELGHEEHWNNYRADSAAHRPPEGETLDDVCSRMLGFFQEVRNAHPSGSVVIAGHGGSLRAILCDALGSPITAWRRISLSNASLSLIEYLDRGPIVKFLNDTSHLRTL